MLARGGGGVTSESREGGDVGNTDARGGAVGGAPPKRKKNDEVIGHRFIFLRIRSTCQPVAPRIGLGGPTADRQQVWT